jgi:hypothetical protein
MTPIRVVVVAVVAAGAIGGSAGAAPTGMHALPRPPSGVTPSRVPTLGLPAPAPTDRPGSGRATEPRPGATGLDTAIAHVSRNLAAHPNRGLANALSHLQANRARHERSGRSHGPGKPEQPENPEHD